MAIDIFKKEQWKEVNIPKSLNLPKYEISNMGRVKSYAIDKENGRIVDGKKLRGYIALSVKDKNKRNFTYYFHRLVAEAFVPRESYDQCYVIHLDYNKQNNVFTNLKWVTEEQMHEHIRKSPFVQNKKVVKGNCKLNENEVRIIKKLVKNNKTRLSMIAKRFNITHTQLNRIRSGENWKDVTI
jgi:hypothetical protein